MNGLNENFPIIDSIPALKNFVTLNEKAYIQENGKYYFESPILLALI